ncbi:MAG TPA: NAD(+)/NADH kinase [Acidimicrobiales bacterium]|nr:NAD(+)/NADH kinase [Acidimicrobiales bacterium]
MATVAFVVHPDRAEVGDIARRAAAWLEDRGHKVLHVEDSAAPGAATEPGPPLDPSVDLAVSLGGDGTMLRTVALAGPNAVLVLGVNLGRLGYLTEVEPAGLVGALERFLAGDYVVEERMTLEVALERSRPDAAAPERHVVLNEAAVEKTVPGHTIRVTASIAGTPFVTYAADGLLVATPTGSTAYNLSARGPILSPGLRAIVLTPLSPHMLFDRPLVLEPEQWVRLDLETPRPAMVVLDGQSAGTLEPGDAVVCRVGPAPARLVTFAPRDFFSILRARFHLADR